MFTDGPMAYNHMVLGHRYMVCKKIVNFCPGALKLKSSIEVCDQYYLLYAQAVLQLSFSDQIYSRVQGPLVLASKNDVGSIEPGHL